jgi:hypothetical protein
MRHLYLLPPLIISLSSCSSVIGDNYKSIGGYHPKSDSRDYYISQAKKTISNSNLKNSLKSYGEPAVFRRTGLKQFFVKDKVNVWWTKGSDSLARTGKTNPVTVESITVKMTKNGQVIDKVYKKTTGDVSYSQDSIDQYLNKSSK